MPVNPAIEQRLQSLPQLQYTVLETDVVEVLSKRIQSSLRNEQTGRNSSRQKRVDIADADVQEVKRTLLSFDIPLEEAVLLLWPAYDTGIETSFNGFAQNYDDLWYPSSDDIWVTNFAQAWVLEISHEEVIIFQAATTRDAAG